MPKVHVDQKASFLQTLIFGVAVAFSLFQVYTAGFAVLPEMVHRSYHLLFVIVLGFLTYDVKGQKNSGTSLMDWLLIAAGLISVGYVILNHDSIILRFPYASPVSRTQLWLGILLALVILELSRRIIGWPLPIVALTAIIYGLWGQHIPGAFGHGGVRLDRLIESFYLSFDGIFGLAIGVSSTLVFMFLVFGAFLDKSGTGEFFMDLSKAAVGTKRGGPAKIAVLASAFFGSISGSAVANVVSTGNFTIPLMKRVGYSPAYAGAVEAVASTGGQLMPPIMGAAAFIMADYLGIPYMQLVKHAVIPALLYFIAVGFMIHFRALRLDLRGIPRHELPSLRKVVKEGFHLLLPVVLIVYFILAGYTPTNAAFWASVSVVLVSALKPQTRMNFRTIVDALADAGHTAVSVAVACATAGLIIAVVRMTGLGLQFSSLVVSLAGGRPFLGLVMVMLASLVLGLGLPTTASYVIQAALAAPALVELGFSHIAAHLFVFYFACIAVITPPVALAAYAAASIAGANPMEVGFIAFRLGVAAYIVPFMFVYSPALLMQGGAGRVILALVTSLVGTLALASASEGWLFGRLGAPGRVLLALAAVLLIKQGVQTDLIGLCILAGVGALQFWRNRPGMAA